MAAVYTITSPSGNFYVGSSMDPRDRWAGHRAELRRNKHHCRPLQRAADKYGIEALQFSILVTCPPEFVRQLEQTAIEWLEPEYNASKCVREPLSNLWKNPEFRAANIKRSSEQATLRFREDPEWVKRFRAGASAASKKRLSDPANIARHIAVVSLPNIAKVNASPELKEKAAEGRRRRYARDPEAAERRRALGREIGQRFAKRRAVICIETGAVYSSGMAAAEAMCGNRKRSSQICDQIAGRARTALGYTWRYLESA